jgi:hypothetical protein
MFRILTIRFIEEPDEDIKFFTEASIIGTTVHYNTSKLHSVLPSMQLLMYLFVLVSFFSWFWFWFWFSF